MKEEIPEGLVEEVKDAFPPFGTHGYEHTERVLRICEHIGRKEGADLSILLPAALLHDIARGEHDHAEVGAQRCRSILSRYGYDVKTIEAISEAVSAHSFSGRKPPKSLEAKILSDADKLDALGAIGVYRTAVYSGEYGRPIDDFVRHFDEKLLKLETLLFTEEAKRMAAERTDYMKGFIEKLGKEIGRDFRA